MGCWATSLLPSSMISPPGTGSKRSRPSATAIWWPAACPSSEPTTPSRWPRWPWRCSMPSRPPVGPSGKPLQLRIGLNTGALIAGVLGTHKFVYDVWGDTVNTAKRMESYGLPGRVHVSATTRRALGDAFRFEPRGSARHQRQRVDGDLFRLSSSSDEASSRRKKRGRHPVRDTGLACGCGKARSRPSRPFRRHAASRASASSRAFRRPSPQSLPTGPRPKRRFAEPAARPWSDR